MEKMHIHDWETIDIGVYKCPSCNQLAVWNRKKQQALLVDELTEELIRGITNV